MGETIHALRSERGISQKDLARELQTTRQVVIKWEQKQQPDRQSRAKLAAFFGVPPETFTLEGAALALQEKLATFETRLEGVERATQPDEEALRLLAQMIREMRTVQDAEVAAQEAARDAILESLRAIEARLEQGGS